MSKSCRIVLSVPNSVSQIRKTVRRVTSRDIGVSSVKSPYKEIASSVPISELQAPRKWNLVSLPQEVIAGLIQFSVSDAKMSTDYEHRFDVLC